MSKRPSRVKYQTIAVDTVKVRGRKYIDISDLICWLHTYDGIQKEIIVELERLKVD